MKKILVLSGGGSHGAWQLGAIKTLIEQDKSWDIIAGVSVGALNGTYLAMGNKESIKESYKNLENVWMNIKGTKDIIKPWWPIFNFIPSFFKGSVKTTKPLLNLINSKFDELALKKSNIQLKVGTVGLCSGEYKTISKEEPEFPLWVLASSTMPLVMPPVAMQGELWVDGGVRNQTPVASVIEDLRGCLHSGEEVDLDIVLTGPTKNAVGFKKKEDIKNLYHTAIRCLQLAVDEIFVSDLDKLENMEKWANISIYQPENSLEADPMRFEPDEIREMFQLGYEQTNKKLLK